MTKVHAPELYEPKVPRRYRIHEAYLRANRGVDPSMLAADLGLQETTVRIAQRNLGLRSCVNQRDAA